MSKQAKPFLLLLNIADILLKDKVKDLLGELFSRWAARKVERSAGRFPKIVKAIAGYE